MEELESSDLRLVKALTSLVDVNRFLQDIKIRERLIDSNLEDMQTQKQGRFGDVTALHSTSSELLGLAISDAEGLYASMQLTSALSEKVSKKIRELDTAQSRGQEALNRINFLHGRTKAIEGVQQAMAASNFEAATAHVESYFHLQRELGQQGTTAEIESSEQEKVLVQARQQLLETVNQQLSSAAQQGNGEAVMRFLRLFSPLGAKDQAVTWFMEHLRSAIEQRANDDYTSLVEGQESETDFLGALVALLRMVGTAYQDNQDFVLDAFGSEAQLQVLEGLQAECDEKGTRLLQRYMKVRRLQQCVQEIRGQRTGRGRETQQAVAGPDPRQLEGTLEEMLALCQKAEEYNLFVLEKAAEAAGPQLVSSAHETSLRSRPLNTAVRELQAYYINMEEFYIEHTVGVAIEIDEWRPDALASSLVDDVFFILQKCSQRGLATRSLACASAIVGQVNSALSASLRAALDARWKASCALLAQRLGAVLASEAAANSPAGREEGMAAAALNNVDLSASYAYKLQEQLEVMAGSIFPAAHDQDRIRSVLADLAKTASDFRHIAGRAMDQLAGAVSLHMRPHFEEADASRYELSEAEYAANEAEFTWVDRLLSLLVASLQWMQPLLTAGNYDQLVSSLLEKVVNRVEASMHVKRFNQLGGLQLDRSVRVLMSSLSEITERPVRDTFAKLSQMATILSLENLSEILEFWGDSSELGWRFSEAQVRAILEQRVDFDSRDIALLDL